MSFNKDALIHKLQDENDTLKDVAWEMNRNDIKEILYGFIDFHTTREIDRLDLKILADRFLDEQLGKEKE